MHRNGHIFSIISNNMAAQGFTRTPEQCQTRLKRLKSNFRQCYQNKYVYFYSGMKGKVCNFFFSFTVFICSLLISRRSLRGQEQVECKFYNELGSLLVKDFAAVPEMEEIPGEPEDNDSPPFSHQDNGKL